MEENLVIPKPIGPITWKISEHIRDHSNDPYIVMMNKMADEAIERCGGFPQETIDFLNNREKNRK